MTADEVAARQSAEAAAASRNDAQTSAANVRKLVTDLEEILKNTKSIDSDIANKHAVVKESLEAISSEISSFKMRYEELVSFNKQAAEAIKEITSAVDDSSQKIEKFKALESDIELAKSKLPDVEKIRSDVEALNSHIVSRYKAIEDVFFNVMGREIKGEDGKGQRVAGLRDRLEASFNELSDRISGLNSHLDDETKKISGKYADDLSGVISGFAQSEETAKAAVEAVIEQLNRLLPDAMAAGLSSAYEEKAKAEEVSRGLLEKSFRNAIYGLVAVSLIPFSVDLYLIVIQHWELIDVIKGTPNILLPMLPLYLPVLWLAYSANKKINLSKRLIEEYIHKSSLGKTFAGLSQQIESMKGDEEVKKELRTNLLFNFLQASAENPGKLITDYNRSDHPIMEALENSSKLSVSLDYLSRIPGFDALAKVLTTRRKRGVAEQAERVADGLGAEDSAVR
ncbi:MAG: hypothetical protein ACOY41_04295 [Pseudomonadota bacterium]